LRGLLESARTDRVFSGAAWSVGRTTGAVDRGFVGTLSWGGPPVAADTLWDLASVTKPIAGLAVMALVERGVLALSDPAEKWLPDYAGTDKARLTVEQLLTHTSGMPGRVPLYRDHPTRQQLLDAVRQLPLRHPPGTNVEYSSQGFMILGQLAETAAGQPLDRLVADMVTRKLRHGELGFNPTDAHRCAATEECRWRGRLVQGTVHDENADVLGGVAAHAGLFATLDALEDLARSLLTNDGRILRPETLRDMTRPRTDHLQTRRSLAWQGASTGDPLSAEAYGHTGFTGTSLWIDPARDVFLVLLTNRVHPRREPTGITRVRRAFHDAALRSL
jgi:CubicO group peptidase (beta-lactamase class C family)